MGKVGDYQSRDWVAAEQKIQFANDLFAWLTYGTWIARVKLTFELILSGSCQMWGQVSAIPDIWKVFSF